MALSVILRHLAVWRNDAFIIDFDLDGFADQTIQFGFPGVMEQPVAADMDGDGIDDLGLYVPRRNGNTSQYAEWYFLISSDPDGLDHPFAPSPLGSDIYALFGEPTALPIVGNFDPPVTANPVTPPHANLGAVHTPQKLSNTTVAGEKMIDFHVARTGTVNVNVGTVEASGVIVQLYDSAHNLLASGTPDASGNVKLSHAAAAGADCMIRIVGQAPLASVTVSNVVPTETLMDVTRDGKVNGLDTQTIIASLNQKGARSLTAAAMGGSDLYLDANQDGVINGLDLQVLVARMNKGPSSSFTAASSSDSSSDDSSVARGLTAAAAPAAASSSSTPMFAAAVDQVLSASIATAVAISQSSDDSDAPTLSSSDESDSDPLVTDLELEWV